MKRQVVISLCLAALIPIFAAYASAAAAAEGSKPAAKAGPKGGCIELTTVAEREETLKNADGSESKRLVPAKHIVPDTEVVWTATAHNLCAKAAEHVVIDQPVPEHMVFVADSAGGTAAQVTLSTDGKTFQPAGQLTARGADGSTRLARAEDVRFVRFSLTGAIGPQERVSVRYRAILQ